LEGGGGVGSVCLDSEKVSNLFDLSNLFNLSAGSGGFEEGVGILGSVWVVLGFGRKNSTVIDCFAAKRDLICLIISAVPEGEGTLLIAASLHPGSTPFLAAWVPVSTLVTNLPLN